MKQKKSILIIDDEPSVGEIAFEVLDMVYDDVTLCLSPIEAKALILNRSYSLILTDVQMPELAGPDLVKWVRSMERMDPIVFLTGHATRDVILSALRLGASDVIEKPFDSDDLLQTLDRVFKIEQYRLKMYVSLSKESA